MSRRFTQQTFFRPPELQRERLAISPGLYNRCRVLHARSKRPHLFVPIRSMQFLAVIDREEIFFVDNQGYAVQDGEGGRLIVLAWQFTAAPSRTALNEPAEMELVHYTQGGRELHRRIMSEFPPALEQVGEKLAAVAEGASRGRILAFRPPDR